jgi:pyruvate formate lyase activating enzyme
MDNPRNPSQNGANGTTGTFGRNDESGRINPSCPAEVSGRVHSIETFGTVDGPGIRFVVFLQGCPWRCRYCHNPDTWRVDAGTSMTASSLVAQACRYKAWFSSSGGGVTVSGGEPLLQAAFVADFFERCRAEGLHTCLDTAGAADSVDEASLSRVLAETDLVLLDIKHTDPAAHLSLTGGRPDSALALARRLADMRIPVILRHVVVPGLTDADAHIGRLVRMACAMENVREIQWLPYHRLGVYKWHELGIPYSLEEVPPADEALLSHVRQLEKAIRADCQP